MSTFIVKPEVGPLGHVFNTCRDGVIGAAGKPATPAASNCLVLGYGSEIIRGQVSYEFKAAIRRFKSRKVSYINA